METEDKKRQMPWVQNEKVVSSSTGTRNSNSTSTQKTDIDVDLNDEMYQPVEIDYTPGKFKYDDQSEDGLLKQIGKYIKRPEFDKERAERLKRVARVNAFGDLMKHLGAFAGGGYAPTQKRQENQGVLRAFQELDKMRDLYDSRMDKYNNAMAGYAVADRNEALNRYNADESRNLQLALAQAGYNKAAKDLRAGIDTKRNTVSTNENVSKGTERSDGVKSSSKNMLATLPGGGIGSKKDNVFVYRDTDGVFNLDKSRLTQFYSTLEKNRDKIKSMSPEEREKFGIGDNGTIDRDLEIMIAGLTGKISLNDANFQRITSKYMDAFRGSDMMKYVLAGSFVPYEGRPDFIPQKTAPYEQTKPGGTTPAPSPAGENKPTTDLKDLF